MRRVSRLRPCGPARYRQFPSPPRPSPARAQEQRSCVALFAHRIPPRHVSLSTLGFERSPRLNETVQYLTNLAQLHGADFLDRLSLRLTVAEVVSLEVAGSDWVASSPLHKEQVSRERSDTISLLVGDDLYAVRNTVFPLECRRSRVHGHIAANRVCIA